MAKTIEYVQPKPGSAAQRAQDPGPGDVLGSFRIVAQIGEGGTGVVYRAEHVKLGRKVALKVLKPEWASRPDMVGRCFGEARAVNEIGHPNIIDIADFIEDKDGPGLPRVYIVMELLSGRDLASYIRERGSLDPAETLEIIEPVLEALQAVHALNIIHRDLKCENIFLHDGRDGRRTVKLLDFGLVKAFGARREQHLTTPGMSVGTPEYMAPEQCLSRLLDQRTDIYAIGVVLYHMLAGHVPFSSPRYGEILVKHVQETPPPLPQQGRDGAPLPQRLQAAVMRCLEKDPARRFQSASELLDELREAGSEQQLAAGRTGRLPVPPERDGACGGDERPGAACVAPRHPPAAITERVVAQKMRDGNHKALWWALLPVLLAGAAVAWHLARHEGRPSAKAVAAPPSARSDPSRATTNAAVPATQLAPASASRRPATTTTVAGSSDPAGGAGRSAATAPDATTRIAGERAAAVPRSRRHPPAAQRPSRRLRRRATRTRATPAQSLTLPKQTRAAAQSRAQEPRTEAVSDPPKSPASPQPTADDHNKSKAKNKALEQRHRIEATVDPYQ